jgi:hypothetical protein
VCRNDGHKSGPTFRPFLWFMKIPQHLHSLQSNSSPKQQHH